MDVWRGWEEEEEEEEDSAGLVATAGSALETAGHDDESTLSPRSSHLLSPEPFPRAHAPSFIAAPASGWKGRRGESPGGVAGWGRVIGWHLVGLREEAYGVGSGPERGTTLTKQNWKRVYELISRKKLELHTAIHTQHTDPATLVLPFTPLVTPLVTCSSSPLCPLSTLMDTGR